MPFDGGVLGADGCFRYPSAEDGSEKSERLISLLWTSRSSSQDWIIPLVTKLVGEGKSVIVFRDVRGATVGCATYLAQILRLPPARETIDALPTGDPSVSSVALRLVLAAGVAFHNSDLDRKERLVIEENLRDPIKALKVIVVTTTLAMGTHAVLGGQGQHMVARAGRLGYADKGRRT